MAQGVQLGRSGNTGHFPHLHFSVHICDPVLMGSANCPSQTVTFRIPKPIPTVCRVIEATSHYRSNR